MNPSWDKRICRAEELANRYAFAKKALGFYGVLTSHQKGVYQRIESLAKDSNERLSLEEELPLGILRPHMPSFILLIKKEGSPKLVRLAEELGKMNEEGLDAILQSYWRKKALDTTKNRALSFFAKAFLQPYAEYLSDMRGKPEDGLAESVSLCPLCGGRPQVGCLRQADNGSRLSLVCSLCLAEWNFHRLSCVACGKGCNGKFPYYTTEDYPHIRLDVCDNCGRYIKTVDVSKDHEAVPVVDELATIPIDIWARQQGYEKIEDNVLGI